jgi:hypothetical protein
MVGVSASTAWRQTSLSWFQPRHAKNPVMSEALQMIIFTLSLVAIVVSLAWVGWDAKQRNRSAAMIVLLCLITWPLGFLFWRIVRPPLAI